MLSKKPAKISSKIDIGETKITKQDYDDDKSNKKPNKTSKPNTTKHKNNDDDENSKNLLLADDEEYIFLSNDKTIFRFFTSSFIEKFQNAFNWSWCNIRSFQSCE